MTTTTDQDKTASSFKWTQQDDAEYNRLANEMNEDSKLQFTLFTFGITITVGVLSFLANLTSGAGSTLVAGLSPGYFFILPLGVLIPTSLVILNRARTRNRKVSFIIVNFDYKRLLAEGIKNDTPLETVRQLAFIPWETALHILDRTNRRMKKRVHLAPALVYMAFCYLILELLCIGLALYISSQTRSPINSGFDISLVIFSGMTYIIRLKELLKLRKETSIQGYVESWLKWKFSDESKIPLYLQEWMNEFNNTDK